MSRKKITKTVIEDDAAPTTRPEQTEAPGLDDTPPDMLDVLNELQADGGSLVLYRRRPDSTKWDRIKKFLPAEFSIDAIPDLYGGGDYLVKVFEADGLYHGQSYTLSFDPRLKGRLDKELDAAKLPAGGGLDAMLVVMQEQIRAGNERFEALLKTLFTNQPTEEKLIEKLKLYKDVLGGSPATAMTPDTVLQLVMKGMDIAAQAHESGDTGSAGMMGMLEKAIAPIVAQVAQRFLKPATTTETAIVDAPRELPAPPPTPTPTANGAPKPPTDTMTLFHQTLAAQLPMLVYQAKRGSDPSLYADLLVDNLAPALYDKAVEFLNRPALMDDLVLLNKEVDAVRPWFTSLQAELLGALKERMEPVVEPDAPRQPLRES